MSVSASTKSTRATSAVQQQASSPAKRGRGRPPKIVDGVGTREKIIRCGLELLTEYGFASVGLDKLLKQAQIPKGSFYHYFTSKNDFALAVIDAYGEYFAARLDRLLLNSVRSPIQRLQDFIADGSQGMEKYAFTRGCLVGNLGQELAASNEAIRTRLDDVFMDWQQRTQTCLQEAQRQGQISSSVDCKAWSEFFWIGWEGAILRAKLCQSTAPIDTFAIMFFAGLQPALTQQTQFDF